MCHMTITTHTHPLLCWQPCKRSAHSVDSNAHSLAHPSSAGSCAWRWWLVLHSVLPSGGGGEGTAARQGVRLKKSARQGVRPKPCPGRGPRASLGQAHMMYWCSNIINTRPDTTTAHRPPATLQHTQAARRTSATACCSTAAAATTASGNPRVCTAARAPPAAAAAAAAARLVPGSTPSPAALVLRSRRGEHGTATEVLTPPSAVLGPTGAAPPSARAAPFFFRASATAA